MNDTGFNSLMNLRVPESEKYARDGEWFKSYMRYIVPFANGNIEDYENLKLSYEVANNNLEGFKDKLQQFCNPLGEDIGELEEEVVPYPELHNKINILKGEMLKRNDDHKIILLTAKAVRDKNEELLQRLHASVDEQLGIELEKVKAQMQGMSEEEAAKYVESLRTQLTPEDIDIKNFLSESEIFYSKALQYCNYDQSIKLKKMDTLEDTIIADRFFVFSGWKSGKPDLEIRNPLFSGYHKSPNERFVHKGDWFWYKKAITPAEALTNYDLTDEQLEMLGLSKSGTFSLDRRHEVGSGADTKPVFSHIDQHMMLSTNRNTVQDKAVGLNQTSDQSLNNRRYLIWETHFEFKAFKQLVFLSYTDEYNKAVVTVLPGEFEIPAFAKKEKFINRYGHESTRYVWLDELTGTEYTAERLWIPRKYEIIRLGSNVFVNYREVPYQYTNIEQPYSTFELSTKGAVFNARNTHSVSLLQRALAPYFQYIYVKHIQNRELSKYQGAIQSIDMDQIPDDLGKDLYGNQIRDKIASYLSIVKKTNKDIYSGSQASLGGLPPATRSPGSSGFMLGTAVELMNLQQLLEFIKREIGMAMGISPQREAAFSEGTNVSDNKQAITQSHHITEPYFFIHSEVWKAALNDWLINFRTYCLNHFEDNPGLKEFSIHYFLPNGTEELLKVTPQGLSHADIGLFLNNSGQSQQYADYMLQLAHAFAQNAGEGVTVISQILKDITMGASPEEIHKRLQLEEEKQRKRQEQLEQAKMQNDKEMKQAEIDAREDQQKHEIEKILIQEQEKRITALEVAKLNGSQDTDDNGIPDPIDVAKVNIAQQKMNLDMQKFEHEKDYDEKDLKIKASKKTEKK